MIHLKTGICFPSADIKSSLFGVLSICRENAVATPSCIKEMDDPESTNISTSFWSRSPRVRAVFDLIEATTTLPTAEGLTASWGTLSLLRAPHCRFPTDILWLGVQVVHKHNTFFLLMDSIFVHDLFGGTGSTLHFRVVCFV